MLSFHELQKEMNIFFTRLAENLGSDYRAIENERQSKQADKNQKIINRENSGPKSINNEQKH